MVQCGLLHKFFEKFCKLWRSEFWDAVLVLQGTTPLSKRCERYMIGMSCFEEGNRMLICVMNPLCKIVVNEDHSSPYTTYVAARCTLNER